MLGRQPQDWLKRFVPSEAVLSKNYCTFSSKIIAVMKFFILLSPAAFSLSYYQKGIGMVAMSAVVNNEENLMAYITD